MAKLKIHPVIQPDAPSDDGAKFSDKQKGFTILELMVVIFVVVIGLLAVYSISSQITSYNALSLSQLTASYLAQEGIEIVRNIRDTNWVTSQTLVPPPAWDANLSQGDWEAAYGDRALTAYGAGRFLKINSTGFYNYSLGTNTKFKRKISITPADVNGDGLLEIKVIVDVNWSEKGKNYSVKAQENLYNWYNQQ